MSREEEELMDAEGRIYPWNAEGSKSAVERLVIARTSEEEIMDAVEKRKQSALELLGPLGFVDNEDGEFLSTIFHPACGVLDTMKLGPGDVVQAIYAIGVRRGEENAKAAMRRALGP